MILKIKKIKKIMNVYDGNYKNLRNNIFKYKQNRGII